MLIERWCLDGHMGRYFDCLKQMVRVNVGKQFCLAQDNQAPLNKQLLIRRCCKVSFTYKTRGLLQALYTHLRLVVRPALCILLAPHSQVIPF